MGSIGPQFLQELLGEEMGIQLLVGFVVLLILPFFFIISVILFLRSKNRSWLVAALLSGVVTLVFALFIFAAFLEELEKAEARPAAAQVDSTGWVNSTNGQFRINPPAHWAVMNDLHDYAVLQMGDYNLDQYMLALSDSLEEFDGSLREHSDITIRSLSGSLTHASESGPVAVEVGGYPALERTLRGRIDGLDISYLHTTVQGKRPITRSSPGPRRTVKRGLFHSFEKCCRPLRRGRAVAWWDLPYCVPSNGQWPKRVEDEQLAVAFAFWWRAGLIPGHACGGLSAPLPVMSSDALQLHRRFLSRAGS